MVVPLRKDWPHLMIIALMLVGSLIVWPFAPQRVPIHWDISGRPDEYASKLPGLFLLPAVALGIYLLMVLLPNIDPGRANYRQFTTPYYIIRLVILLMMGVVHAIVLLWALGLEVNMVRVLAIALGLAMALLGNLMGKIRPNWFVGVRTPWTLASKRSWVRTHRMAGLTMTPLGLLIALAGVIAPYGWLVLGAILLLVADVIWLTLYSYLVWRSDPERISSIHTTPE